MIVFKTIEHYSTDELLEAAKNNPAMSSAFGKPSVAPLAWDEIERRLRKVEPRQPVIDNPAAMAEMAEEAKRRRGYYSTGDKVGSLEDFDNQLSKHVARTSRCLERQTELLDAVRNAQTYMGICEQLVTK